MFVMAFRLYIGLDLNNFGLVLSLDSMALGSLVLTPSLATGIKSKD